MTRRLDPLKAAVARSVYDLLCDGGLTLMQRLERHPGVNTVDVIRIDDLNFQVRVRSIGGQPARYFTIQVREQQ